LWRSFGFAEASETTLADGAAVGKLAVWPKPKTLEEPPFLISFFDSTRGFDVEQFERRTAVRASAVAEKIFEIMQ
jgi:hypothetical protein